MTIDSVYLPQIKASDDEVRYTFEYETLGIPPVEVWLIDEFGNRILLQLDQSVEVEP